MLLNRTNSQISNLTLRSQTLANIIESIEIFQNVSRIFTFHEVASRVLTAYHTSALLFSRGIFRAHSNIKDEVLLRIQLTALRC